MMRWIVLALVLLFCMSCRYFDCNGDDTPEEENGTRITTTIENGDQPSSDPRDEPGEPEVIHSTYVRLERGGHREFSWTSTGPGTLTASGSWPMGGTATISLAKGATVAQKSGASPLQVSATVGAAGQVWTVAITNNSGSSITVAYMLVFTPQ